MAHLNYIEKFISSSFSSSSSSYSSSSSSCSLSYDRSISSSSASSVESETSDFSINFLYPLVSLRLSNSCLCLLPRLPVPFIFLSITCIKRHLLSKTWLYTSQTTHCVSITKINSLMPIREIIGACYEEHANWRVHCKGKMHRFLMLKKVLLIATTVLWSASMHYCKIYFHPKIYAALLH
jgi:hypothetical protein